MNIKKTCNGCKALIIHLRLCVYGCQLGYSMDSELKKPNTECPKPRTDKALDKLMNE